jgi:hypothetical protein
MNDLRESSGLRIRLDAKLRQEFLDACRTQDRTAAQVLRDFMRKYVAQHYKEQQISFFETPTQSRQQ